MTAVDNSKLPAELCICTLPVCLLPFHGYHCCVCRHAATLHRCHTYEKAPTPFNIPLPL